MLVTQKQAMARRPTPCELVRTQALCGFPIDWARATRSASPRATTAVADGYYALAAAPAARATTRCTVALAPIRPLFSSTVTYHLTVG